jgi:hypothetical protein
MRLFVCSCLIALIALMALMALSGCATPCDKQPLNRPVTPAFVQGSQLPRDSIVRHSCSLGEAPLRRLLPAGPPWRCDGVQFCAGTVSAESLEPARAERLRHTPTRLVLPADDLEAMAAARRDAAPRNPALWAYLADRRARP